ILIEDMKWLVTELRELRAPAGSSAHSSIIEDRTDDVDLLSVIDLVPDGLQDLSKRRALGVTPVHQAGHVLEADIACQQLLVIEYAKPPMARDGVAFEREV